MTATRKTQEHQAPVAATHLVVDSLEITDTAAYWQIYEPAASIRWGRGSNILLGFGALVAETFQGSDRFTRASAAWNHLVETSELIRDLQIRGSGLISFGSFSFASSSTRNSVMVVPRIILGHRDGRSWITVMHWSDERFEASLPEDGPSASARAASDLLRYLRERTVGPTRRALEDLLATANNASESTVESPGVRFRAGQQSPAGHEAAVDLALQAISDGRVNKVVLARDLVGDLHDEALVDVALSRLSRSYPDCWVFKVDGLVGASPETLIRVQGRRATSRVLAGSTARDAHPDRDRQLAEALLESDKDAREHDLAVASVTQALHKFGPVTTDARTILKLATVSHLATDVTCTLDESWSSLDILAELHPTAAVGGAPKQQAVALLDALEPFDRGRYAGPVGWTDAAGNGEWAIALRCAQIDDDGTITAYAGGGIVEGSDPAAEVRETDLKLNPIIEAFR